MHVAEDAHCASVTKPQSSGCNPPYGNDWCINRFRQRGRHGASVAGYPAASRHVLLITFSVYIAQSSATASIVPSRLHRGLVLRWAGDEAPPLYQCLISIAATNDFACLIALQPHHGNLRSFIRLVHKIPIENALQLGLDDVPRHSSPPVRS